MSTPKTVILVGGGHAHALLLRQWAQAPIPNVALHVFDPCSQVPYTGMLPGFVAGHYSIDDLYIDIQGLTVAAGGVFHPAAVTAVNPDSQTLSAASSEYAYDIISFDIGIHTTPPTPTTKDNVTVGVKPLTEFADRWQTFITNQMSQQSAHITIIGGGVAGVEVALAMAHRLKQLNQSDYHLQLLERGQLLNGVSDRTRQLLSRTLEQHGVTVRTGVSITNSTAKSIELSTGEVLASDFTLFATGPQPYPWIAHTGLPLTDGYISVDPTLRSTEYPTVFAVGDCAHFAAQPLPKAGVYAVRQAPILYQNIRAAINGTPLQTYVPQTDYLKLISLGDKRAVANKWGLTISGAWLWKLKNYIDNKFMQQFSDR